MRRITLGTVIIFLSMGVPSAFAQEPAVPAAAAAKAGSAAAATTERKSAVTAGTTEAGSAPGPANAPGVQTEETPAAPHSATDRIVARFMALDTDASGGVSADEYMAWVEQRARARFEAMDANGDGEVSDEEYRAFWKSRMAHWYRLKR
jgi:hypothetical protein